MPPLPDPRMAVRAVYDAVAGFRSLQSHLDDPEIEEIWINEPGRVLVARGLARVEVLQPYAQRVATEMGKPGDALALLEAPTRSPPP